MKGRYTEQTFYPPNIRLDEDALKTSWRRLSSLSSEDVFKTCSRHLDQDEHIHLSHISLEDIFKTSSIRLGQDEYIRLGIRLQDVCKTFWRRLQDVFLPRCLQDVLKTSSRRLAKTSSRHLQDVFKTFWRRLQDVFETSSSRLQDILKTSSRCFGKISSRCFQDVSSR